MVAMAKTETIETFDRRLPGNGVAAEGAGTPGSPGGAYLDTVLGREHGVRIESKRPSMTTKHLSPTLSPFLLRRLRKNAEREERSTGGRDRSRAFDAGSIGTAINMKITERTQSKRDENLSKSGHS
jgi:hypothetical protein